MDHNNSKSVSNNGANSSNDRSPSAPEVAVDTLMIDVSALQQQVWLPEAGAVRFSSGRRKVRSATDGPLRGGDFVLNKDGGAATLSFCFQYESENFGLTVGHLALNIGDSIFAFSESEPIPHPPDDDHGESYFIYEIGKVVSYSEETDSLVFRIATHVQIADCLTLAPASGLQGQIRLPTPNRSPTPPGLGSVLVGFGAQCRGGYGTVHTPAKAQAGTYTKVGNIGIVSPEGEDVELTNEGDFGTLFLGTDGYPWYFHHALSTGASSNISWGSFFPPSWLAMPNLVGKRPTPWTEGLVRDL
jgi:hypothetical protein